MKTKVINKQNLEHFKMINWRLFSHKFFKNSKMFCHSPGQYSLEFLCFLFYQGPKFLRWSTCAFRFYWFFNSFSFSTKEFKQKNNYIAIKNEKFQLCFDTTNINLFWYNKSQSRSFIIQLETTMQWLRKFERKIICDEIF